MFKNQCILRVAFILFFILTWILSLLLWVRFLIAFACDFFLIINGSLTFPETRSLSYNK